MKDWITALLSTQDARDIHREYRLLLSVGMSEHEAENEIILFFISNATVSEQGRLWILFALIQWKMGRMSERIYSTAKHWLERPLPEMPDAAVLAVADVLASPLPSRTKVAKPRTIKCPWKEGTLLAYRISTYDANKTHRFWNKYVLLRIVEIKKWPISAVMPELLFDESMYVALYNWVGEAIPTASIVENLEFIPISVSKPLSTQIPNKTHLDTIKSIVDSSRLNMEFDTEYAHYVYALDWGNRKEASSVFTQIAETNSNNTKPPSFNMDGPLPKNPPLIGCAGFDIVLIKCLDRLFPEHNDK